MIYCHHCGTQFDVHERGTCPNCWPREPEKKKPMPELFRKCERPGCDEGTIRTSNPKVRGGLSYDACDCSRGYVEYKPSKDVEALGKIEMSDERDAVYDCVNCHRRMEVAQEALEQKP